VTRRQKLLYRYTIQRRNTGAGNNITPYARKATSQNNVFGTALWNTDWEILIASLSVVDTK
jgi:hypothetical protein